MGKDSRECSAVGSLGSEVGGLQKRDTRACLCVDGKKSIMWEKERR